MKANADMHRKDNPFVNELKPLLFKTYNSLTFAVRKQRYIGICEELMILCSLKNKKAR